jgi:hypothetical protein
MAQAIARFDHHARLRQRPAWSYPLFVACAVFTGGVLFAMWARSIWTTEQLERPKLSIDLAIAPSPPPPPPPPAGGEKPRDPQVIVPKVPDVLLQPVIEKPPERPHATEDVGSTDGQIGGVKGGDPTSTAIDGVVGEPPRVTPPPVMPVIPKLPRIIPPAALEASRIAGDPQIEPDDVTKTEIQRSGQDRIIGTFKICLAATGDVTSVTTLKHTGFAAYDSKIASTIRSSWRYRPFSIDNTPTAVCTAVTFVYSQR